MVRDYEARTQSGAVILLLSFAVLAGAIYLPFVAEQTESAPLVVASIIVWLVWMLLLPGFFVVEPNGSKVLVLFGSYLGTVKRTGFHWANPFASKRRVSLRARTLMSEKLKVNDLAGNPIEIAAAVVWQVRDTFTASFVVDNYEQYVATQSETALRQMAQAYPYDAEDHVESLRRNTAEVSAHLTQQLNERLCRAGVEVLEARLSHLAYAPEIAGAMLRRQQASAVIAARQIIVEGAVGMVEMALRRLEEDETVRLDDERKAVMVSNLLVVLCGEQAAQPVVNTGTLYS
ncbi:MAG TPA: SPFH domain-containing protein [Chthonomonadales bacterium]|nr:SPFH domain-containing protein [Chthonomonadales bacterium]